MTSSGIKYAKVYMKKKQMGIIKIRKIKASLDLKEIKI